MEDVTTPTGIALFLVTAFLLTFLVLGAGAALVLVALCAVGVVYGYHFLK